ncbi:putative Thioredoxin [uncultured archaeon]|nr:putative Thioredoxin [uncultured archaeon]
MKYLPIILLISFLAVPGCLESSNYKIVSPSELLSNTGAFEGKQVCINGVFDNNNIISGILIAKNQNFTGDNKNGTFANVCGTYKSGKLEPDSINPILSISTEKEIYHSNETLQIQLDFNSPDNGKGEIQVSGIKNAFDRPSINEKRDVVIVKGSNRFDFEFKTPSCEECSAIEPGIHYVNTSVIFAGKTYEGFKKITLERESSNVSSGIPDELQINNTKTNYSLVHKALSDNYTEANNTVTIEYFYTPTCPKCGKASPVIESIVKSYGDRVNFTKYNANTDEGLKIGTQYGLPEVPSIVINKNKERIITYADYEGDTEKLKTLLIEGIDRSLSSTPANDTNEKNNGSFAASTGNLSVPYVFVVGFWAGFNPCLLAILAFIASVTLATTGKRRNVLLIVLMFSLGIFVTYLIVGIGILTIFEQSETLQNNIQNFLVVLIGILGLWHIYDAYHLRKNTESSFYTPKSFIRLTESVTKKVSLPASFFMGALFSLIKAPCVGAVYFVILKMVRSGEGSGILYLAAYNLGVVFPVFILGAAIAFGLNPEKVEKFRKEKRSLMRLITGITLISISLLMYARIYPFN